jgi:hypothetical protein
MNTSLCVVAAAFYSALICRSLARSWSSGSERAREDLTLNANSGVSGARRHLSACRSSAPGGQTCKAGLNVLGETEASK